MGGCRTGEEDEFELKSVYWTSELVNARFAATFSTALHADAAIVLSGLVGDDPSGDPDVSDAATCRLMLAAIKVSGGDLARLALWVDAAHSDPRDLIAAAEYRRQLEERTCDSESADLAEYLAWVRGELDGEAPSAHSAPRVQSPLERPHEGS